MAAPAVIVTVFEVTEVKVPEVKLKVRSPTVPVIFKSVKVANPFASVVALSVPPKVVVPEPKATVITTPD